MISFIQHSKFKIIKQLYVCHIVICQVIDGANEFSGCASKLDFPPLFSKLVVEVKASGPPHVLKLWLVVSKYLQNAFPSTKPLCCVGRILWRSRDWHKVEGYLVALSLGDIGYKTVMSV